MTPQQLYQELCETFPELREHPERWTRTIELLLKVRPKDQPDHLFKAQLEETLRTQINKHALSSPFPWRSVFFGSLGTVAVMSTALVLFWQGLPSTTQEQLLDRAPFTASNEQNSPLIAITNTDEEAFGTLLFEESAINSANTPRTGGGDTTEEATMEMSISSEGMRIMPPFGRRINITYTLEEALPAIPESVLAYRKTSITETLRPALLEQASYLPIAISGLQNLSIQSLSFNGTMGEHTYSFTTNISDGTVHVHQDISTQRDMVSRQYTESDRISDEELITIAQNFLNNLQVNTTALGAPIIEKPWETQEYFGGIPETITVIFPLEIDGNIVKDQWGSTEGISLSVHQPSKSIHYATIPRLSLQSSDYATLTSEVLAEQLRNGGLQGVTYNNPEEELTVPLSNPRIELRSITTYAERETTIYLPVLVVDTKAPEGEYQWVVPSELTIPLVKNSSLR